MELSLKPSVDTGMGWSVAAVLQHVNSLTMTSTPFRTLIEAVASHRRHRFAVINRCALSLTTISFLRISSLPMACCHRMKLYVLRRIIRPRGSSRQHAGREETLLQAGWAAD